MGQLGVVVVSCGYSVDCDVEVRRDVGVVYFWSVRTCQLRPGWRVPKS